MAIETISFIHAPSEQLDGNSLCTICRSNYDLNIHEIWIQHACKNTQGNDTYHRFHENCLMEWIRGGNSENVNDTRCQCPLCRKNIASINNVALKQLNPPRHVPVPMVINLQPELVAPRHYVVRGNNGDALNIPFIRRMFMGEWASQIYQIIVVTAEAVRDDREIVELLWYNLVISDLHRQYDIQILIPRNNFRERFLPGFSGMAVLMAQDQRRMIPQGLREVPCLVRGLMRIDNLIRRAFQ